VPCMILTTGGPPPSSVWRAIRTAEDSSNPPCILPTVVHLVFPVRVRENTVGANSVRRHADDALTDTPSQLPAGHSLGCGYRRPQVRVQVNPDRTRATYATPFPHDSPPCQQISLESDSVEPGHTTVGIAAADGQHAAGHTNTAAEAASGGWQPTHCHVR
jgi:hypothetical protein